ncbi:MAG: hypothetical protein ACE5HS_14120 [bacterium]
MLCEHLKEFSDYVKENQIEIGGLDLIKVVCKKCQITAECPYIPLDDFNIQADKDTKENDLT